MAFRRGQIYLANFNPAKGDEPGKIRPCLILQSDLLNNVDYPTTTLVPLTTQLSDGIPLRYRVSARDNLAHDSDLMLDQLRTIDNKRFLSEPLTELETGELETLTEYLEIVLGFQD